MNKSILIVLTGSIACSKVIHLISNLSDFGYGITVLMTDSAREFVTKSDFKDRMIYSGPYLFISLQAHLLILIRRMPTHQIILFLLNWIKFIISVGG